MPRRDQKRRSAYLDEPGPRRSRLLVLCEGKVTETTYLKEFVRFARNELVSIEVLGAQGVPRTIVDRATERRAEALADAKAQKDSTLEFDEVWCVFDRDEHPHYKEAIQIAIDRDLKFAASNPCFELWLLLHVRDSPGPQHHHRLQEIAKVAKVTDGKHLVAPSKLLIGYSDAVRRAERLDRDASSTGNVHGNPTTGVYQLTERIRSKS